MFLDSHSHLSFLNDEQVGDVILRGREKSLSRWCLGGYDKEDWERQRELKKKFSHSLVLSFGIHPWKVLKSKESDLLLDLQHLKSQMEFCQCLGEIGLDFHRPQSEAQSSLQYKIFRAQLELAGDKPVILHGVKAHGDILKILDEFPKTRGLIHAFAGSAEIAKSYTDRGFFISVGRGVLNVNHKKLPTVVKTIDPNRLLIESDTPCSPDGSEDPVSVFFSVAEAVANIRGMASQALLLKTSENMRALLDET